MWFNDVRVFESVVSNAVGTGVAMGVLVALFAYDSLCVVVRAVRRFYARRVEEVRDAG